MNETYHKDKLKKVVESLHGWFFKIHGGGFFQKGGVPDVFVAVPARNESVPWMGWIELKVEGNKCSPLQTYQIRKMITAGCRVLVVTAMKDGTYAVEDANEIYTVDGLEELFSEY